MIQLEIVAYKEFSQSEKRKVWLSATKSTCVLMLYVRWRGGKGKLTKSQVV